MVLDDGTKNIIAQFGETVTIIPQGEYEPETSDNVFFEKTSSSESSFEEKVRVYSMPSEPILKEYGFEEDSDFAIYAASDIADIGDNVEYDGQTFTIREKEKKQLGNGTYRVVYELVGVK